MSQIPAARADADRDLAAALSLLKQLQPALERRDRAKQVDILRQLVSLRAPLGGQWQAIANLALQHGEIGLAIEAMDLLIEVQGGSPRALYLKAGLLERAGRLSEAYELMSAIPPDIPDPAAHAYSKGTAALFLGLKTDAREQLLHATQLAPGSGSTWLSLAMSMYLGAEPEIADRILAAEVNFNGSPSEQKAAYFYAKGKALADVGEHREAFGAFADGAKQMKALLPYDRNADRRNAEDSVKGYRSGVPVDIRKVRARDTSRTIFVTGTPRSGTTLVEQILCSHSEVSDGAEINHLVLLAREMGGHSFPVIEAGFQSNGISRVVDFWRHLLDERFPRPGRVVDKSLTTTRLMGIAASLLPDAPLIWVTRDPLDRAWSCFRTYFQSSMPWSYDLEDIAFHFRLEDELLTAWQDILGERLLVVRYEALVTEPDDWIRRILAHCNLPVEHGAFRPHESKRTVATASVNQVRQPINRNSIAAANPYREFLEPFGRAYHLTDC